MALWKNIFIAANVKDVGKQLNFFNVLCDYCVQNFKKVLGGRVRDSENLMRFTAKCLFNFIHTWPFLLPIFAYKVPQMSRPIRFAPWNFDSFDVLIIWV